MEKSAVLSAMQLLFLFGKNLENRTKCKTIIFFSIGVGCVQSWVSITIIISNNIFNTWILDIYLLNW